MIVALGGCQWTFREALALTDYDFLADRILIAETFELPPNFTRFAKAPNYRLFAFEFDWLCSITMEESYAE